LLSDRQFGFRPGSSTQEAILFAMRDWHDTLEKRGSVVCVFFDLSKAFDSLPHSLVLASLTRVGVCGTLYDWFVDYLSGRSQCVVLEGASSPTIEVTSGVPQGSILGPLLFCLSMDTLSEVSLSSSSSLNMYADDIVFWKPILCDEDLSALQDDISSISEWVSSSGLRLNATKSKCLVISRKSNPPRPTIRVKGNILELVSSHKYLGVTITNDLSWSTHINHICCKARKMTGFLYRNFKLADKVCLSHLFKSLVRPILEYCSCVWDPHQDYNILKLERVQNFAARLTTGRWDENPEVLHHDLAWPLLSQRRVFQKLCLARRILTGGLLIPDSFFTPHPVPNLRHLNSCPLMQPSVTTNCHCSSFFISVVSRWNSVPDYIVSLSSNLAFKRHLKEFMDV